MFDTVSKPDYAALEGCVLRFWEESGILRKLMEKNKDGDPWLLLDGPVTANNRLGVHHGWGRTYKDIFQRFRAMCGHRCRWQNGFDCHGLWVEVEVEKAGEWSRESMQNCMGQFVNACQERTVRFADEITKQSIRLGQWNQWTNSYRTDSAQNIDAIWRFLKVCCDRGLLRQQYRVMPWCTRCGTSLSHHEMADSYQEREDTSVFFLCPLVARPGEFMMVWTTTPWTIPANVALAVKPDAMYSCIQTAHGAIWMAKAYKDNFFPDTKPLAEHDGKGFLEARYTPPHVAQPLEDYRIIPWDAIDPNEGSGIVHIAPGCGAEDWSLKKPNKLRAFLPTDAHGIFTSETGSRFEGMHWSKVNKVMVQILQESGALVSEQKHKHSYPHCWRCHEPLIFRLCREWFILTDPIKERLKEVAKEVNWTPDYIRQHMMNWLDSMGDWCISRRRFWGLPLPFYPCSCGFLTVIGSVHELRGYCKNPEDLDAGHLHRPWIDKIQVECPHCYKPIKRVEAVGDCWLDAGIVPFSTTKEFPNDFVCEMREQVRLWFYSTLLMSVVLEDKAPYKTVMTYDEMRDEKGEKFSKTKGNAPSLDKMIAEHGADALRYTFALAPTDSIFHFSDVSVRKGKKLLNMVWNCWSFFAQNANAEGPMPFADPSQAGGVLNRWILARLKETIRDTTQRLENYNAQDAMFAVEDFVEDLSTWYIRLQRPWISGEYNRGDYEQDRAYRIQCLNVMWSSFRHIALLLAPIMPFTAEALWAKCRKGCEINGYDANMAESVFLAKWPEEPQAWSTLKKLCDDMDLARDIVQMGLAMRNGCKIKVRQPLHSLSIDGLQHNSLEDGITELIIQELNIEAIVYEPVEVHEMTDENLGKPWGEKGVVKCTCHDLKLALNVELSDRLREKGAVREIMRAIQDQRKKIGLVKADKIKLILLGTIEMFPGLKVGLEEITKKCGITSLGEAVNEGLAEGWFDVEVMGQKKRLRIKKL